MADEREAQLAEMAELRASLDALIAKAERLVVRAEALERGAHSLTRRAARLALEAAAERVKRALQRGGVLQPSDAHIPTVVLGLDVESIAKAAEAEHAAAAAGLVQP